VISIEKIEDLYIFSVLAISMFDMPVQETNADNASFVSEECFQREKTKSFLQRTLIVRLHDLSTAALFYTSLSLRNYDLRGNDRLVAVNCVALCSNSFISLYNGRDASH